VHTKTGAATIERRLADAVVRRIAKDMIAWTMRAL
jgi:hypothetical protein